MLLEQHTFDLTNPTISLRDRPLDTINNELNPGGIKAVKTENRRNDSVVWMSPDKITPQKGFNARFNTPTRKAKIRSLADSMKREGYKPDKPISCVVEDDGNGGNRIVPFDGHTRLEAVMLANAEGAQIDVVPVFLAPKTMSMDDMIKALVTNNNGTQLSMLETAIVVKRLVNRGHEPAEIAEDLDFTQTHVDNLITLAGAPKALHDMIISEQVAATMVVEQIKKLGVEKATALFKDQVAAAQAKGKTKVTAKDLPDAKFNSGLKRSARRLFDGVTTLRQDPGYSGLSAETREQLDTLFQELEQLRAAGSSGADAGD